ncbi:MAG: hypothetical protein V1917_04580 [Candidatus Gottesmanbacteria bacterium]
MKEIPFSMQGLGVCKKDAPCAYHGPKIGLEYGGFGGSVFPPDAVWGQPYLAEIAEILAMKKNEVSYTKAPLGEKLTGVLHTVNDYWIHHTNDLNGPLHTTWKQWSTTAQELGLYAAGGWAASPHQLSQFKETVKVLHMEEKIGFDDVLRVGTASGIHTQQEIFALGIAGIKKPTLFITDLCMPPLKESEAVAQAGVGGTILGSFLNFHERMNNSWQVVTAHFVESFLPTAEEYSSKQMTREDALGIKTAFFQKTHDVLIPGGVFIQILGTGADARRFHTPEEIQQSLVAVGFDSDHIFIVPTTDPMDYENGVHLQGNYFVVAQKGNV